MKQNLDKYQIESEQEKTLWSDCLFVFDSSSLLNFYNYSVDTRKNIFDTTLKVIKERLWIPQHVEFEFLKNRETTFKKPISKYQQLLTEHLVKIDEQFKQLRNKSKKENMHPYISDIVFSDFDIELDKFKEKLKKEINERISEIEKLSEIDDVLLAFDKYFKVGKEFNYQQLTEIAKEGEFRYKYSIPPGYKDLDEKSGFQIFGDLIIWKQIIEYAKAINKPIILITDDVKEDWWHLKKRGEPERPREELIDEIEFHANVPFWMYTTIQFLEKSKKHLDSKIKENSIMEVRNTTLHYYGYRAEEAFTKWAISEFKGKGEIIHPDNQRDSGIDLVLQHETDLVGFEIRFFRNQADHYMRYRLRRTIENFQRRKIYEKYKSLYIVIITESEDSALMAKAEIENDEKQLFLFEDDSFALDYIYGYLDEDDFIKI